MKIIDGSYLEGGGQIVRTALALSALSSTSFKVTNIRKGRKKPGLKNQHLLAVETLKDMCDADVIGNNLGSETLIFKPKSLNFKNLNIDIKTAGSITLLMQALLPVMMFSNKKIKIQIIGGTDTKYSMPIDYFRYVFLPHLRQYIEYEDVMEKRGYFPKGQGKYIIKINPKYCIKDFKIFVDFLKFLRKEEKKIYLQKQGELLFIKGISHASKDLLQANVAERQAKTARYLLHKYDAVKIDTTYVDAESTGSGVVLWALFSDIDELNFENPVIMGADSLGERGVKAEKVGESAVKRLIETINSETAVDKYLADQLLPYMALFGGIINVSNVSDHVKTNIYVIEKFLNVKFKVKGNIISC